MELGRCALLAVVACSSNKPRAVEDAPAQPREAAAVAVDAAPPAIDAPPGATGDLQVRVEWKDVPIAMRASPGRTACNTPRAPVVAPTTTWGIPDVIVVIAGMQAPPRTARIVLADCALSPRAAAATEAIVASAAERPARVTINKRGTLADLAKLDAGTPRTIALPIAGHAVAVPLDAGGVYELAVDGEKAWVVAATNAGVTDAAGHFVVRDLAPGRYPVTAWLPSRKPVSGTATVTANDLAEVVLQLE